MHLAIECPLSPVLPHPIPHHHLRNVLVAALMHAIGPALDHRHGYDLHVQQLHVIAKPRHALDERLTSTPRALRILSEHLPHFVEPPLGLQLHEAHLKGRGRDRHRRRRPHGPACRGTRRATAPGAGRPPGADEPAPALPRPPPQPPPHTATPRLHAPPPARRARRRAGGRGGL